MPVHAAPRTYSVNWSWSESRWNQSYSMNWTFYGRDLEVILGELNGEMSEFLGIVNSYSGKFPFSVITDLRDTLDLGTPSAVDMTWEIPFLTTAITIDITQWSGLIGAMRAIFGWLFVVIILRKVASGVLGLI